MFFELKYKIFFKLIEDFLKYINGKILDFFPLLVFQIN